MKKYLIVVSLISLAIFAFFFSNIKGYYRFKQYCEAEGGLRVYEPLERNVGWLADDKYAAQFVLGLSGVGFARYSEDGVIYDLHPVGPRSVASPKSDLRIADTSLSPIYKLEWEVDSGGVYIPTFISYRVRSIIKNKVVFEYKIFKYAFFNSEHTPLETNEKFSCFDEPVGVYKSRWEHELENNFVN